MPNKKEKRNNDDKKYNVFKLVISAVLTVLLVSLAIACITVKINAIYTLGIVALNIAILAAMFFKIPKNKSKQISITTIVLDLISIPLILKLGIIFSYIITVPAFILSIRNLKAEKSKLNIIAFALASILFAICLACSIIAVVQVTASLYK